MELGTDSLFLFIFHVELCTDSPFLFIFHVKHTKC